MPCRICLCTRGGELFGHLKSSLKGGHYEGGGGLLGVGSLVVFRLENETARAARPTWFDSDDPQHVQDYKKGNRCQKRTILSTASAISEGNKGTKLQGLKPAGSPRSS